MQAKRRPLQMTGFQKLISCWIMRESGSHTDILTLVSIVKGSNATSGLRRKFETGPPEPMSTKYSQLRGDIPQSLTNNLYDAQKVGSKNSKNILKFLHKKLGISFYSCGSLTLKSWNKPDWEIPAVQARAEWAKKKQTRSLLNYIFGAATSGI